MGPKVSQFCSFESHSMPICLWHSCFAPRMIPCTRKPSHMLTEQQPHSKATEEMNLDQTRKILVWNNMENNLYYRTAQYILSIDLVSNFLSSCSISSGCSAKYNDKVPILFVGCNVAILPITVPSLLCRDGVPLIIWRSLPGADPAPPASLWSASSPLIGSPHFSSWSCLEFPLGVASALHCPCDPQPFSSSITLPCPTG